MINRIGSMTHSFAKRWVLPLLIVGLSFAIQAAAAPSRGAVASVIIDLDKSWLLNSPAPTLVFYADDAMVMQGGAAPWHGKAAIQAHWWPVNNPVTITAFKTSADNYTESGDMATVSAHFDVSFTMLTDGVKKSMTASGNYVTVLRRTPAGEWRITLQMWAHD